MINQILSQILKEKGIGNLTITKSDRPDLCDYQSNDVFKISKELGKSPQEVGKNICERINLLDNFDKYFEKVEFIFPGFLNIKVNDDFINKEITKMKENKKFNVKMPEKKEVFVVDYCGANVAKPLHVGHMRTTIVGESVARIIRFLDHKTICDVHLGDYGLQIGQVIYAILRDKKQIEETDIK